MSKGKRACAKEDNNEDSKEENNRVGRVSPSLNPMMRLAIKDGCTIWQYEIF